MQCQLCQVHEASVHLKQIINDEVSELHVCEMCAASSGVNLHKQLNVGDLAALMSNLDSPPASASRSETLPVLRCRECHMSLDDYRRSRRLGCAACYDAFREPLADVLLTAHKGKTHVGKRPPDEGRRGERRRLQRLLEQAIADQRFEEAAVLRDQLKDTQPRDGVDVEQPGPGDATE